MCGFLFVEQFNGGRISLDKFSTALVRQGWRGPDSRHVQSINDGRFLLGHNRLSIIDPTARADQPMVSSNGRYVIVYNGEIYNHREVRKRLGIQFVTESDTETILEGFASIGERIFEWLDGMFALVILDTKCNEWIAARDSFGIKPMFIGNAIDKVVIGSEPAVIAHLIDASPCKKAIDEWKLIRRPVPGESFFSNVSEVLPGTVVRSDGKIKRYWQYSAPTSVFEQDTFEQLLIDSIKKHELSDVTNVSLLSGGLDSAVITAVSSVAKSYCIGLAQNNEFEGAAETACVLNRELIRIPMTSEALQESWRLLTQMRGEPLSLPNEGLIYTVCKQMLGDEKVVLTGEGADELLFGYDGIFRWATTNTWGGVEDFLCRYGYAVGIAPTDRLIEFIESLRFGKSLVEFVEDFFYQVHLPGLLRRMDFASMAASKEARVPFVNKELISYMYRRPSEVKISNGESKIPLRIFAKKLGLAGALERKKIGFSAQIEKSKTRFQEYSEFQNIVLGVLKW